MEDNMKNSKKLLSLLLALVMMVGVFAPLTVLADNATEPALPGTSGDGKAKALTSTIDETKLKKVEGEKDKFKTNLFIHKLIREEAGKKFGPNFPVDHDGGKLKLKDIQERIGEGATVKEISGVEFTYYKVPTAQKLEEMKANPEKYDTAEEMDALVATQGSGVTKVGAVETTTDEQGVVQPAKIENLEEGYYWFIETKRPSNITKAIAVPFPLSIPVLLANDIVGTGSKDAPQYKKGDYYLSEVHVYPKNEKEDVQMAKGYVKKDGKVTKIDSEALTKTLTDEQVAEWKAKYGAEYDNYLKEKESIDARKGSAIPYVVPTLLKKGQIYEGASWTDRMTKGLSFVKASDVAKVEGSAKLKLEVKLPNETAFTDVADTNYTLTEYDNGFDLVLTDAYIKTINEQLQKGNVEFKLTYFGYVNGETVVDKKENNNITFKPGKPDPGKDIETTDGSIQVNKTWSDTKKDRNTVVTYVLEKDGKTVASVTLDGTKILEENYVKRDGNTQIKFELDANNKYSGKFTGLENATYKIREFVNGYEAEYTPGQNSVDIKNKYNPTTITPRPPKVETYNFKFVKTDGQGTRLAGAEFYVTRKGENNTTEYLTYDSNVVEANKTAYTEAEKNYNDAIKALNEALKKGEISADNKVTIAGTQYDNKAAAQAKINDLAIARDNAYAAMKITWTWTTEEGKAFVFTSNQDGQIEVEGLAYGTYELVEKTAPAGFGKLTSPIEFKMGEKQTTYNINYKKDAPEGTKDALEVVNKNLTIPQTGGIGTVIFTVVGIALMAGAVIAMKKSRKEA